MAEVVIPTKVPALAEENAGMIVPGVRSYTASQLALYLIAIQIGQNNDHLSQKQARKLRVSLDEIINDIKNTPPKTDGLQVR